MREFLRESKMETMRPEERFERIERSLEFLAANQAQLSAAQAQLSASIQSHDAQIAENSRQIAELAGLTLRIGRIVEEQERRMDEGFTLLTESQTRTDERMNALINVVERYFSNGRN